MDKSILKKFAIESRQDLMVKIKNKIKTFYIDEEFSNMQKGDIYILSNDKHTLNLTSEEFRKRELLIKRINELSEEQVIEEATYTWFNRIVAIRYMEINDILPISKNNQSLGIRVLSSRDNTPDPEILKFSNLTNQELDINFNKERYVELKDDNDKFKYILLLVCKKLGKVIPQVFDGITDYIDILIPDNLLNDTGFITKIINEVPEENFKKVEIIGWLYQYYITERKSVVEEKISNGNKMSKEDIPPKTQLFTPEWIVRYMVENSLGSIFRKNNDVIDKWEYFDKNNSIEDKFDLKTFKIIDPCCGSGHILVYVFEKLYELYLDNGFAKNEICKNILENNIYGLDIDDRAYQLTVLSLILKAREYDKFIFEDDIKINVMPFIESSKFNTDSFELITDSSMLENAKYLIEKFVDSKEYGSILKIEHRDYRKLYNYLIELENNNLNILELGWLYDIKNILIPICKLAMILSEKYDCMITNPPYLSSGDCSSKLNNYLTKEYKIAKKDLYATFMITDFLKPNGVQAMINQHNWMFLSSYKELREYFINNRKLINAIHLGTKAFDEISGEKVQSIAFIFQKNVDLDYISTFIKLDDYSSPELKEKNYKRIIKCSDDNNIYKINIQNFKNFDSFSFVYWVDKKIIDIFKNEIKLMDIADAKQGMATGNNDKFVRCWFEVDYDKIGFNRKNIEDFHSTNFRYVPYIKSAGITKWWGNYYSVLKFDDTNYKLLSNSGNKLPSRQFYFKDNINWSLISTDKFGARFADFGGVFDVGAHAIYTNDKKLLKYIGGFLNTKIFNYFVKCMNPTLNYNSGAVQLIPYKKIENEELLNAINELEKIFKEYWDFNEVSWDFKHFYIQMEEGLIKNYIKNFNDKNINDFNKVKHLEQLVNDIFKREFNLDNEIDTNIEDKDITLKIYKEEEIIKDLINYFVGCLFGRYSLDKNGLCCRNSNIKIEDYITYNVDKDNVVPITEEQYFEDDLYVKFKEFISVVFGKDNLNTNIDYVAEVLVKKGTETSDERIRRYFIEEFYKDHCNKYSVPNGGKNPIYWLFDSGKKNGIKALVYMHRYNENLIPKIRLDYLHRVQTTYEKLLSDVNYKLTTDLSMTDKKMAQNRQADLNAKLNEIKEYDEKIAHIANQRISIDLDDGVKVNYEKFKDILAKIK